MEQPTTKMPPDDTPNDKSASADLTSRDASHDASHHAPSEASSSPRPKPTKTPAVLVIVSVLMSIFLIALDRTIIATAIPQITNEFNSLPDVGWYGSAYLLTMCAFQLLFGKLYTIFPVKTVLLMSTLLFELASALCGAAPNSVAFIVGRAICGIGGAGIIAGSLVCITQVVSLEKRPQIQGMMGALMGIASVAGPLIGGGFTSSSATWRWCFYINLPFGALAMLVIFFFLHVPGQEPNRQLPLLKKLAQLDIPGTTFLVPCVVSLLLALQWGGQTYAWSNARIIVLLTLTGVLLAGFAAVQILLPTTATLPPRLFKQRSVVAALWSTFMIQCGNYVVVFFLPIWFQSIQGTSAAQSGIRTLPFMLSMVLASIASGFLNTKIGYYTPIAIVGSCIMAVGSGLFTTLQIDTGADKWIGYQVLYGIGLGLCFQVPNIVVQAALPKKDVPTGLALILFGTLLGAAVFVAVGENVLGNQLVQRLSGLPGFDPSLVTSGGATSLLDALPPDARRAGLEAYNESLRTVFRVGLIPSCLSVLGAASFEWLSVKKKPEAKAANEDAGSVEEKNIGETKG
ncbi:hypothetical protein CDD83_5803 [Cordyceps sp. RAO-2017]|nr:hypothetical protein CDD83_5803 [Cordyceps sp. RAO-2017]